MKRTLLLVACVLLAVPVSAQQQLPPEVVELLKSIKAAGDKAGVLLTPPTPPSPPPAPIDYTLTPKTTAELQTALDKAPDGSVISLTAGIMYDAVILGIPNTTRELTVTTTGWSWPDALMALPPPLSQLSKMGMIRGAATTSWGMWVKASGPRLKGLAFLNNASGNGEMLRLGDSTDGDLSHVPHNISVLQCLFLGNTVGETATGGTNFGQKRAIALNSADTLVDQIWCQDIFMAGQDSQCVAVFSTPGNITVRRSFLSSASEPMIVGGVPPAGPAFLPDNVLVEYNVMWHPPKWKGRVPAAVVKNLFELKLGTNIVVRKNLMVNHWQQAQPGFATVLTMATNGSCSYCKMGPVLFEDNVVINASAGLNITGWQYSYAPGAGQFTGLTVRNNLYYIDKTIWGGNGRPIFLSNEMKDATFDHNTFIHNGSAFLYADYGTKWPYQDPPLTGSVAAGPMFGISYTNNIAYNGPYGASTPIGNNGARILEYFPDLIVGGNVLAGAPSAGLTIYNSLQKTFGPNVAPTVATLEAAMVNRAGIATDPSGACLKAGSAFEGKGADCSRLADVFALAKQIPQ